MNEDKIESGFIVPGLVSIEENENGSLDIVLEDDKIEEFYNFFGLQVGDEEGLQNLIIEALSEYISQKEGENVAGEG
jgi:hypothetical protein